MREPYWIPVSMSLPKMGQRVLVVCTNLQNQMQEHVSIASWWPVSCLDKTKGIMWSGHRHVTHWAPLPELPNN